MRANLLPTLGDRSQLASTKVRGSPKTTKWIQQGCIKNRIGEAGGWKTHQKATVENAKDAIYFYSFTTRVTSHHESLWFFIVLGSVVEFSYSTAAICCASLRGACGMISMDARISTVHIQIFVYIILYIVNFFHIHYVPKSNIHAAHRKWRWLLFYAALSFV